jgi:TPR repeat protein
MFALGEEYDMPEQGRARRGMERDERKAEYYYNLAAQRGYTKAKRNLATLRLEGADAEKHSVASIDVLKECAEAGDPACHFHLAYVYFGRYEKSNVKIDDELAMRHLIIAAQQEYPKALFYLGEFYINGFFFKKDVARGIRILQIAANHGHAPAIDRLKDFENK